VFGSDGSAITTEHPSKVHPRFFGTFTRILRKYVRDERVLPLEEAIRKMTSASATKLGIMDRGIIRPDFWADITIFDPLNVRDTATIANPMRYSKGIEYVFVNGVLTLENNKHTGALSGKPLRHISTLN
jgi:N-acyl-D-aspartate/D-glutamate deacylase